MLYLTASQIVARKKAARRIFNTTCGRFVRMILALAEVAEWLKAAVCQIVEGGNLPGFEPFPSATSLALN